MGDELAQPRIDCGDLIRKKSATQVREQALHHGKTLKLDRVEPESRQTRTERRPSLHNDIRRLRNRTRSEHAADLAAYSSRDAESISSTPSAP